MRRRVLLQRAADGRTCLGCVLVMFGLDPSRFVAPQEAVAAHLHHLESFKVQLSLYIPMTPKSYSSLVVFRSPIYPN